MDVALVAQIIIFTLGLVALLYTIGIFLVGFNHDIVRRNFAIFCLALSFWILSQTLLFYITDVDTATWIIDVVYTLANVVALMFSIFIASLTRTKKKYHEVAFYSSIGFIIGQILLFTTHPVSSVSFDEATGITTPIYNYAVLPLIVLYPVIAFVLTVLTIIRSNHVTQKAKNKLLATGAIYFSVVLLIAFSFPNSGGGWPIVRFALINIVTLTFMFMLSKQVFLERLIDLRKSGWRMLLRWVAVWISLLVSLSVLTVWYVNSSGVSVAEGFWNQFFQTILTAGVSLLVVLGVDKLVRRWLKKYEPNVKGFNQALSELHFDLGYENLSKQFLEDIALFFRPAQIFIVLEMLDGYKVYAFEGGYTKTKIEFEELQPKNDKVRQALQILPHAVHGKLGMNISGNKKAFPGYSHLFDIQGQQVRGVIVISDKNDGIKYSEDELLVLESAVQQYSLLLENSAQFEKIQNFNITLKSEVDSATKELSSTYEKLQALDATKDEFISMASHQLRTPLTSVKGYVSMILEGDAGEITPLQRDLLNQSFISSQRMVYLIADLLNVSRLKSGKFVVERRATYLPDLVKTELDQVAEVAKGRGLKLEYIAPKTFPTLMLDETKTRQVIMNFTDNAIFYTPKGGSIKIELTYKGDSVSFTVKDNGIGVPKKDQKQLFAKFFRSSNARKARPDGTGLGLFMAKKVVMAQGGQIVFESEENKGSTFGFKFPVTSLEVPRESKNITSLTLKS